MNHGMMQFTTVSYTTPSSHLEQTSTQRSSLTSTDLAEMHDWLAHLPIQDEQIRAQIAQTLNILQRSYQLA